MLEEEQEKVQEYRSHEGVIDLQYMGVNKWTIIALSSFGCHTLTHLNFSRNELTNETLLFLTKFPLINLRSLDIHWNRFNGRGIQCLIKGNFPALQAIYAGGNELGIEGLCTFLLAEWNLVQLGLSNFAMRKPTASNKMKRVWRINCSR